MFWRLPELGSQAENRRFLVAVLMYVWLTHVDGRPGQALFSGILAEAKRVAVCIPVAVDKGIEVPHKPQREQQAFAFGHTQV